MPRQGRRDAQSTRIAPPEDGGAGGRDGKTRPPYPPEFRAEAVRLAGGAVPLGRVARDLGVRADTLRGWVKRAQVDAGEREDLSSDERAELARLRRENRVLREEREILKKAAAFFAAEGATR